MAGQPKSERCPTWCPEADALVYVTSVVVDARQARQEYLKAEQDGRLTVRARPTLMALTKEWVPREEFTRCIWVDSPDPLSTGFHFYGQRAWYDREVRWVDIAALWPAPTAADDGKGIRDSVFRWLGRMTAEERAATNNQLAIKWLEWKAGATQRYVRSLVSEYKDASPKR